MLSTAAAAALSEQLHQNVEYLQSLLFHSDTNAAATMTTMSQQQPPPRGANQNSRAARSYEIRSCLRRIQSILESDDFAFLVVVSSDAGCGRRLGHGELEDDSPTNNAQSYSTDDDPPHQGYQSSSRQTTIQDLVTLLTLNVENDIDDPTSIQLVQENMMPRIMALLNKAPNVANTELQKILHRILVLLQLENNADHPSEVDASSSRSSGLFCLELLQLFQRHATCSEQFQWILNSDQDLFVAMHILFMSLEKESQQQQQPGRRRRRQQPCPPPLELAVLINHLMEYWAFYTLTPPASSSSHHPTKARGGATAKTWARDNDEDDDQEGPSKDIHAWLQQRYLHEHKYSSPDMLRRDVDTYIDRIEHYGAHLIESSLRLLEVAAATAATPELSTAAGSTKNNRAGHSTGNNQESSKEDLSSSSTSQHLYDDSDDDHSTLLALQYAELATNFLVSLRPTTFSLLQNEDGGAKNNNNTSFSMSRALWTEFVHFVVHRFSDIPGHDDDPGTTASNSASSSSPRSVVVDYHLAATDVLWRLAQFHYPVVRQGQKKASSTLRPAGPSDDVPLIITTLLRLWKHANPYWNQDAEDWIRHLLQDRFPFQTFGGKMLRNSLQAIILSYVTFPTTTTRMNGGIHNRDTSSSSLYYYYPRETVESLMNLVLQEEPLSVRGGAAAPADPWNGWVLRQLSREDAVQP